MRERGRRKGRVDKGVLRKVSQGTGSGWGGVGGWDMGCREKGKSVER